MSLTRWISCLCFLLTWAGLNADSPPALETSQTRPIPATEDAEIAKAITKAQEAFPTIWIEIEKERRLLLPKITTSLVKGWFFNPENNAEGDPLWVKNFTYDPATKTFTGITTTQSEKTHQLKKGDPVSFPLAHLTDWIVVREGIAEGAFTVQVLRSRMDRTALREHDEDFPFDFPDIQPQPPQDEAAEKTEDHE